MSKEPCNDSCVTTSESILHTVESKCIYVNRNSQEFFTIIIIIFFLHLWNAAKIPKN